MNSSITNRQLFFLLFVSLTAFSIANLPKIMAQSAGYGTWFTLLLASVLFGLAAVIIVRLNLKFQGETIFEYSGRLIGKKGTYGISIYYILYFSFALLYMIVQFTSVLKSDLLFKTPQLVCIFAGLALFGFVAYKGITNIARLSEIFGVFHVLAGSLISIAMMFQSDASNILPLFNPVETGKYIAALKDAIFPFMGVELLLVIPFTSKNGKNAVKIAFWTLIAVGIFYVLIAESCIMRVGMNEIVHYNDATIVADRETELPFLEFLKRTDVFYLTIGYWAAYIGASTFYTAIVEFLCRIFKKLSRLTAVLIVGAVLFFSALVSIGIKDLGLFMLGLLDYLAPIAIFLIPCVLLLITKIKEKKSYR